MQKEPQIIHRIIQILVESPRRRVDLAKLVGKTPRTITRYFDKIEELEYLLEKDSHGRYFIFGGFAHATIHWWKSSMDHNSHWFYYHPLYAHGWGRGSYLD